MDQPLPAKRHTPTACGPPPLAEPRRRAQAPHTGTSVMLRVASSVFNKAFTGWDILLFKGGLPINSRAHT